MRRRAHPRRLLQSLVRRLDRLSPPVEREGPLRERAFFFCDRKRLEFARAAATLCSVASRFVEYKKVYQPPAGTGRRRWFSDQKDMDFIVWYSSSGHIRGFQLCYDLGSRMRAFTWHREQGFSHSGIVSDRGLFGSASPILSGGIPGPIGNLIERFVSLAEGLEPGLTRFVRKKMNEYECAKGYPQT